MLTKEQKVALRKSEAEVKIGKKLEVQVARKALSVDEEKKTVTFVMSTTSIDRHGDIVDQDSWLLDYFLQSPMFFLQHRSDEFPIGKWLSVSFEADPDNPGKNMMVGVAEFRTEFEDAARAFTHVVKGDMAAVSVGFIPHRVEYDEEKDAFILYHCELLECSLVGIGSNRQALAKSTETADAIEAAIAARKTLDTQIKKSDNTLVISHLKARDNIDRAIRILKKAVTT